METGKRIILADAGAEFRAVLAQALAGEPDFQVVGETGDGGELIRLVRQLRPDAVVMELVLTGTDGLEVLRELSQLTDRPRILVLSNYVRGNVVDEAAAREARASGKLAGLSVDVLANELAGKGLGDNAGLNSDLFGMEHFTVSPHIGGSTHEAYDGIGVFIVEKAAEFYGLSK